MDSSLRSRTTRNAYVLISALLWITVAIGVFQAGQRAIGAAQGGYRLSVPASAVEPDIELPSGFEVAGAVPLRAVIVDPSPAQLLLATGPPALWWAGAVAILWLLQKLARSVRKGDPFRASNVHRLRQLGFLFLVGYPLATIIDGFLTNLFFSSPVWPAGRPFPSLVIEFQVLSGTALLAGVGLLVLAGVFSHGVRLREDVDATV
jgi:hypothetical protein